MSKDQGTDPTLAALQQMQQAQTPRARLLKIAEIPKLKAEAEALLDLFPEFKHYPTRPGMELEDALLSSQLARLEQRASRLLEFGQWSERVNRDMARQRGTRAPRFPECDEWMDKQLRRQPDVKAPELWSRAPDWITDRIGFDRFCKRVTAARKRKKAASK